MSEHRCHAVGCDVATRREMLMCRRHWFMVPRPIRERVLATYRRGQCDLVVPVSPEWAEAAIAARRYVADLEGRGVTPPNQDTE